MTIRPPRRIDWSQIIRDLERLGMTMRQIGAECDKGHRSEQGKSWVSSLKNIPGTEPRFHEGALLIGLWAEKMLQPADAVPREDWPLRGVEGRKPGPVMAVAVGTMRKG